jgi:Fe-S cluster assembly protein SufD
LPNAAATAVLDDVARAAALAHYRGTRSGRDKPGRYWKIDLEALELPDALQPGAGTVTFSGVALGIVACDLETAARERGALLDRAYGVTAVRSTKFGALATAYAGLGALVYVARGVAADEPIVITYSCADGQAIFPATVVLLEDGARATIVERFRAGAGALVCTTTELVTGNGSDITYVGVQTLPQDARILASRAALVQRDARVAWAFADLGAELAAASAESTIVGPGARVEVTALFFPSGDQHVDLVTSISHDVGNSTSDTIVKSAATQRGQARYLGNIRIAAHAQQSAASLRDDALLLSKQSHIDSVPALEIAANDVRAFHGATVGAIDREQIFYMESRGIEPREAERMIALGFFEPAIGRFPSEALREELRAALRAKAG